MRRQKSSLTLYRARRRRTQLTDQNTTKRQLGALMKKRTQDILSPAKCIGVCLLDLTPIMSPIKSPFRSPLYKASPPYYING